MFEKKTLVKKRKTPLNVMKIRFAKGKTHKCIFLESRGSKWNNLASRLTSDSHYTQIFYRQGEADFEFDKRSRKTWEKTCIIESATCSFGNMYPAIIDQKLRFPPKWLKYDNISYKTEGGATQCTKSDFEPKRANAQIKNKWCS